MDLLSGVYYTIARDGQTFGPYEGSQLSGMVTAGQLVATDQVWTEGMAEWLPAASFNQLAPLFQPQQPAQPQVQQLQPAAQIQRQQPQVKTGQALGATPTQARQPAQQVGIAQTGRESQVRAGAAKPGAKFGLLLTLLLSAIAVPLIMILILGMVGTAAVSGTAASVTGEKKYVFITILYAILPFIAMGLALAYVIVQLKYTHRIWSYLQGLPLVKRTPNVAVWMPFIPVVGGIFMILIRIDLVKEFERYLTASGQNNPATPRPTIAMQMCGLFVPFMNLVADKQLCDSINFLAKAPEVDLSNAPAPT